MSIVVAGGLTLGYRNRAVFSEADFDLPAGRLGVLGPNGAGKSTLLRAIATLSSPAGGSLRVLGEDVGARSGRKAIRAAVAYLPQQPAYSPTFTVREHVEYCGWLGGVERRVIRAEAEHEITRVGLLDARDQRLGALSGGQVRRAMIAGALVRSPRLLILDEPTVGLDPEQRVVFREIVAGLDAGVSVLISTHLVEDVSASCTDVAVLADGSFRSIGPVSELAERGAEHPTGMSALEAGYLAVLKAGS